MKIHKIYFDMDGVLADFDGGVSALCGIKAPGQGKNIPKAIQDSLWEHVKKIDHFYDKLDPMPGALDLFFTVYEKYGDRVEILSGIPKPRREIVTAAEDKVSWAHRLLSPDLKVNTVFREEKKLYCTGASDILIDDYDSNIEEWEKYGGTGILYLSPEDTLKKIRSIEEAKEM